MTPSIPEGMRLVGWTSTKDGKDVRYTQGEQITVNATSGTNLYPVFENANTHILVYSANGGDFANVPDALETVASP